MKIDINKIVHETIKDYCCACDYDKAVFEQKIQKRVDEAVNYIAKRAPRSGTDGFIIHRLTLKEARNRP